MAAVNPATNRLSVRPGAVDDGAPHFAPGILVFPTINLSRYRVQTQLLGHSMAPVYLYRLSIRVGKMKQETSHDDGDVC